MMKKDKLAQYAVDIVKEWDEEACLDFVTWYRTDRRKELVENEIILHGCPKDDAIAVVNNLYVAALQELLV